LHRADLSGFNGQVQHRLAPEWKTDRLAKKDQRGKRMAVSPDLWHVEASFRTPLVNVEARQYGFPAPVEVIEEQERPILSLTFPRIGQGDGKARFADGPLPYRDLGSLIFRPPGVPLHAYGRGGPLRILTCEFETNDFEVLTGLKDWSPSRLCRCLNLRNPAIHAAMRELAREISAPGFGTEILVESITSIITVQLARTFRITGLVGANRGKLADWQLRRVRETLLEIENEWPSIAKLAASCGVSRSHFSRVFTFSTGQTLSEYSKSIRIQRAKTLLQLNETSISEASTRLGFTNAASFSTAFRRETGMSPSEYARRNVSNTTPSKFQKMR
jgi:AraC family transcriptional regulator